MSVLDDLVAEHDDLDAVVAGLGEGEWLTATPADGWDVKDSVAHLAWSEELAGYALDDPNRFDQILRAPGASVAAWVAKGRSLSGADVLSWWRSSRTATVGWLRSRSGDRRVPWAAGPMSPTSFATARLMETWAHGQDVRDGLGFEPAVSARLRHIADLGVRTRPFSYRVRSLALPADDVRVELVEGWSWGDSTTDVVRGTALDFCLVVTQRRHPHDTDLQVEGKLAVEWLGIAQAFAGPATGPRERSSA